LATSATIPLRRPLDLQRTLARTRPARVSAPGVWRATRTPAGPGTERLWLDGDRLRVEAWGPGADWLCENAATLVGEHADDSAFAPRHRLLAELRRRHLGVRLPRTEAVLEALVPTILEQKVIGKQARSAYRRLLQELGEPAPGPQPLLLPPSAATLATTTAASRSGERGCDGSPSRRPERAVPRSSRARRPRPRRWRRP